jgi:N-acetylneuraminic acid mutarotase
VRRLHLRRSALFLLLALACVLSARLVAADVPHLIAFSGRLADPSGTPLADGSYSVTFRIYDQPEEGTALWEETDQVELSGGVFGVILGGLEPLSLGFDTGYWISLALDTGQEMQPRVRLCAAPYALNSDRIGGRNALSTPVSGALLAADGSAKFPNEALHTGEGEGLDADTVDGFDADYFLGRRQSYVELAPEQPQSVAAVKIEGDGIPLSSANASPPDGFVWEQRFPTKKPSARDYFAMCSIGSGKILLFGGNTGGYSNQTWIYSTADANWRLVETGAAPSARQEHSMAFDPESGKVVLFGGFNGSYLGDTWLFDVASETWSQVEAENAPSARADSAMVCVGGGEFVLFGGYVGGAGMNAETWVLDLPTLEWAQVSPSTPPPKRYGHGMAYDSLQGKVVLYGGLGSSGNLDDTWAYDPQDSEWSQMAPAQTPGGLRLFPTTYSPVSRQAFVFGGFRSTDLNELWAYSLAADKWEKKEPFGTLPGPRRAHGFCYDPESETFIAFGGFHSGLLGDTWGLEPYQSALAASFDLDTYTTGNEYAFTRTGSGRDLAELLLTCEPVEAGDVVVIAPEGGAVERCRRAVDTRAAGIVSVQPSLLMGVDRLSASENAVMVALAGRVACKVDAVYGEIRPGDLLVTSPTPGHAMRAPSVELNGRAVYPSGAIVGKALEGLRDGRGKIQVLVGLR